MPDLPDWGQRLVAVGIVGLVALIATWLLRWLLGRFAARLRGALPEESPAGKRAKTLVSVLGAFGVVVIWLVAFVTALEIGGVPVGPLIATAGIGGVALGFGMQNLVRDYVAGLFVLSENQYDVGDSVKVAGVEGTVEAITLRSTVLRAQDGSRHVVSNGEIRVSTNTTRGYSRCLVSVVLAYDADLDAAIAVTRRVVAGLEADHAGDGSLTGPGTVLGVDAVTPDGPQISCFIETTPGRQFALGRELRRRLLTGFRDAGVSMPPGAPPAASRPSGPAV